MLFSLSYCYSNKGESALENELCLANEQDELDQFQELLADVFREASVRTAANSTSFYIGVEPRTYVSPNPPEEVDGQLWIQDTLPMQAWGKNTGLAHVGNVLHERTKGRTTVLVAELPKLCSERMLYLLATTKAQKALGDVPAQAILCEAWQRALPCYLTDACNSIFELLMLLWLGRHVVLKGSVAIVPVVAVAVTTSKDAVWQFFAMRVLRLQYLSFWKLIELATVGFKVTITTWAVLAELTLQDGTLTDSDQNISFELRAGIAFWAGWSWVHCLWSLRGLRMIGPRFLPIFYAVKHSSTFFVVCITLFCACVHSYYILDIQREPSRVIASLLTVFRLTVLGDFDLAELEGVSDSLVRSGEDDTVWDFQDPSQTRAFGTVQLFFVVASLAGSVLLMNLLIGILSTGYDLYCDKAEEIFMGQRAGIILNCISVPPYRYFMNFPRDGYLVVLVPNADDPALAQNSLRTFVDQRFSQLDDRLQRLEDSLLGGARVTAKLSRKHSRIPAAVRSLRAVTEAAEGEKVLGETGGASDTSGLEVAQESNKLSLPSDAPIPRPRGRE